VDEAMDIPIEELADKLELSTDGFIPFKLKPTLFSQIAPFISCMEAHQLVQEIL
jgi:hypothetical protein